jgi:hypothetical protein
MTRRPAFRVAILVGALVLLTGCSTGSLATSDSTVSASTSSSPTTAITGPTLIVTVPDLVPPTASASATMEQVPSPSSAAVVESVAEPPAADVVEESTDLEPDSPPAATAPAPVPEPAPEPQAEPAPAPAEGQALNVSLVNCDGCTVLATHRDVAGDLSAALVGTGSGRAILLSVGPDGQVAGVIGVPYGAAFPVPSGGVLACAQRRCIVQGRQSDGRAILSAFELTGSGAWRDVSGDDAFPSATERAAVVDLGGELAIAVQDQGDGAAVWMLYSWAGDRFAVIGCSTDGDAPASAGAVSPEVCLS